MSSDWQRRLAQVGSRVEHVVDDARMAIKRKVGLTEPLSVQVYRGYGTPRRVMVSGRVIEDEDVSPPSRDDSAWDNLVRSYKTFETDEVHGARVRVTFAGESGEATTGREGFFEVAFEGGHYPAGRQEVTAELLSPLDHAGKGNQEQTTFRGEVFVPRPQAEFMVISDVDDTVMHTRATSLVRMVLNTVLTNAYGRVAFPGVGEFYRALARGTSGGELAGENPNAFFYLTSSMWNVYDVMRLFFDANGVPAGPILMRDLGLTRRHLLKGTHSEHKLARVEELMDLYDDKRFVLIGDTGQHDAEIYGEVARARPERVAAVYLRDVSGDSRDGEIKKVLDDLRQRGVPCVAAETSRDHARHAAEIGLIAPLAVEGVHADADRDESEVNE